jgi:hypothetical protein
MSGLRDAIAAQQRALGELKRSREASAAWSDEQRHRLDRQTLEPLAADGQRLLQALRAAAQEIAAAQSKLSR